jgi:hypothetical protein
MKALLTNWKMWAAALLAAFVAFNEIAHVVDPGVQHTVVAVAAALGIVLTAKQEAAVAEAKREAASAKMEMRAMRGSGNG